MDNQPKDLVNKKEGEMCHYDTFTLDELANNIFSSKKLIVMSVLNIGKNLCLAKSLCKHGEWLKFLEDDRVQLSRRTAQRYMQIYKALEPYLSYTDLLNELKFSELYNLIMMDKDDMEELITTSNTVKELQEGIKSAKEKCDKMTHLTNEDIGIVIKLSTIKCKYGETDDRNPMYQRMCRLSGYSYGLEEFNSDILKRVVYGYNEYFDILAGLMEDLTYIAENDGIVQTRAEFITMKFKLLSWLYSINFELMETNYEVAVWLTNYCKTNEELKFGDILIDTYTLGHVYNKIINSDNADALLAAKDGRLEKSIKDYMCKNLKDKYSKEELEELSNYYKYLTEFCDGDIGTLSFFMFDTMIIYLEFLPLIGFYMDQE